MASSQLPRGVCVCLQQHARCTCETLEIVCTRPELIAWVLVIFWLLIIIRAFINTYANSTNRGLGFWFIALSVMSMGIVFAKTSVDLGRIQWTPAVYVVDFVYEWIVRIATECLYWICPTCRALFKSI